MKKHILFLLITFSVDVPSMAQNSAIERVRKSTLERLDKIKSRLNKEVDEFKKCIKQDQSCDPLRKKIYISAAVVGALALALGTGTGIWRLIQKNQLSLLRFFPQEYVEQQIGEIQTLAADGIERVQGIINLMEEGRVKENTQQLLQELQDVHAKISQESTIEGKIPLLKQMQELQQKINALTKDAVIKPSQALKRRKERIAKKEQLEKLVREGEQRKEKFAARQERHVKTKVEGLQRLVGSAIEGQEQTMKELIDPAMQLRLNEAKKLYAQAQKETDHQKTVDLLQQADELLEQNRRQAISSLEYDVAQLHARPEEKEVSPAYKGFATEQIGYVPTGQTTIRPSVANIARAAELREQRKQQEARQEAERLKK